MQSRGLLTDALEIAFDEEGGEFVGGYIQLIGTLVARVRGRRREGQVAAKGRESVNLGAGIEHNDVEGFGLLGGAMLDCVKAGVPRAIGQEAGEDVFALDPALHNEGSCEQR